MSLPTHPTYEDVERKPDIALVEMPSSQEKAEFVNEAIAGEQYEKETILQSIKSHRVAVFWSVMVSMLIVMEAYDNLLITTLIAQTAFRQQFGTYISKSAGYQLSAAWQSGLSNATTCGAFFGILICGQIVEYWGYKRTTMLALVVMIGAIFLPFFASTLPVLLVGEIACGIPWGFASVIGSAYASEIAPVALRGIMTMFIQLCWCIGFFISAGVMYSVSDRPDKWAYKIPFGIQWVWPVPLMIILSFAPESPWWLVRKGRMEEAEAVVRKLNPHHLNTVPEILAMMTRTTEIERAQHAGVSYLDLFKGVDLRRTAIVCGIYVFQNLSGLRVINSSVYFFEQAGFPASNAFKLGFGNQAIQLGSGIFCWFLIAHFGRRSLYLWGVGVNAVLLTIIGIVACLPKSHSTTWAQASLIIITYASYGLIVGPITYIIVAETSSVRLRAKSVGASRCVFYLGLVSLSVLGNYMLNPSAWGLAGKSCFVWAGTSVFVWVVCFFQLPECKGRSYRELDILFQRRVPARKFASTVVDPNDNE